MKDTLLDNLHMADINPRICGVEACAPGHSFGPAVREYFLLHYVVRGKGIFRRGKREYTLQAGEIFVIRPGEVTYYEADMRDPWEYMWAGFDCAPPFAALLEQDVPVLMTNFPTILNRMTGLFGSDRADFLANLNAYDLLILDDLGAERGTEYALEQVFAVIDARYRSRKPLIVTTNLTLDALKHPDDLAHARIYDRILEICAPILFGGENLRVEKANEMKTAARNLLLPDNAA